MMGSHDKIPRVEGDVVGFKKGCDCSLCTASEFMLKCFECACEGGKYKYKKNSFHRCRVQFEHTECDWRQDDRVRQQVREEVWTLCTKCHSGFEEEKMLLCDGYVPPRIVLQKKRLFLLFCNPHAPFQVS